MGTIILPLTGYVIELLKVSRDTDYRVVKAWVGEATRWSGGAGGGNEGKTQETSVTFSTITIFLKCPEKMDKWKCLWEATDFPLPYVGK